MIPRPAIRQEGRIKSAMKARPSIRAVKQVGLMEAARLVRHAKRTAYGLKSLATQGVVDKVALLSPMIPLVERKEAFRKALCVIFPVDRGTFWFKKTKLSILKDNPDSWSLRYVRNAIRGSLMAKNRPHCIRAVGRLLWSCAPQLFPARALARGWENLKEIGPLARSPSFSERGSSNEQSPSGSTIS